MVDLLVRRLGGDSTPEMVVLEAALESIADPIPAARLRGVG